MHVCELRSPTTSSGSSVMTPSHNDPRVSFLLSLKRGCVSGRGCLPSAAVAGCGVEVGQPVEGRGRIRGEPRVLGPAFLDSHDAQVAVGHARHQKPVHDPESAEAFFPGRRVLRQEGHCRGEARAGATDSPSQRSVRFHQPPGLSLAAFLGSGAARQPRSAGVSRR